MNVKEARELAQKSMSKNRFQHTLGVVEMARKLAGLNAIELEKTLLAAYLHDLAKEVPLERQVELAREWGLLKYPEDETAPYVLHGPLAAYWLEKEKGLSPEIGAAIAHHTLGVPGMSRLEMLIYSADLVEPNRDFPEVDKLREALYDDLEKGTLACMEHTLNYLKQTKQIIHPLTLITYEDLKRRI
ncbi:bis(5'-nucleosyl)-tetraphosphatase (symmetrical) YqeK [Desulfitobacterium metallireducens]|uniref:bis(5'-nucleosyl)-tetraphosphatase (symmetrical) n=1 Tax=Desulfitobacterium metallireducens DSM 15288 TaxID=871968 RepID=W0EEE8_9FIRM|nr:bis(5'-nucleosyl)-tetraphosphatase (symmetrical) YqeK [Desulfitobacterium metallireducens]AHF07888.1 phosphohydrolase [Desulfitobacterium metallireducens DSM 15288]